MPELPEVEVTRRTISQALRGARVRSTRLGKPLRWPLGGAAADIAGREVGEVSRRGKYLWLPLGPRPGHGPDDAGGLLLHLGMSGSLGFFAAGSPGAGAPPGPHDHFDLLTSAGLLRLRNEYTIAPLSNGNVSLLLNMAKNAGLPWDTVLSAELSYHYKPDPEAYLKAAELFSLRPEQVMLVAAHPSDLRSAAEAGAAVPSRPARRRCSLQRA